MAAWSSRYFNPSNKMSTEAPPVSSDPNAVSSAPPSSDPNVSGNTFANSAPAAESWAREWLKPDGSLDHKAFEKAPEALRPMAQDLSRYKTWDEFLSGHRELASMAGKKGLVEPLSPTATQAQKDERSALLRKVNGAPEKAEGYGLARPPEVPEDMWDQAYADTIAKIAHTHGLPPAALKDLAAAELKYAQTQVEENKRQQVEWFNGQDKLIRDSLGKEGLDFVKGKDLAERAGRKFGVDPANPLMKNASVFMLLSRIGRMMSEDTLVQGDTGGLGPQLRLTEEQAMATAQDIMTNKANPDYAAYRNREDPRHASVYERVNSMLIQATKNKPRRAR